MQGLFIVFVYLVIVLGIILLFLWNYFNFLVKSRNQVKTDYSDINIQLNKKAALMGNLLNLVRQYTKHENETFKDVAKARSMLDTVKGTKDTAVAENMLTQTLRSLFMVAENYPKLEASQNYRELKQDLLHLEESIANYREEYNQSVQAYNNAVETFPGLLAAFLFGFKPAELYQVSAVSLTKEQQT